MIVLFHNFFSKLIHLCNRCRNTRQTSAGGDYDKKSELMLMRRATASV